MFSCAQPSTQQDVDYVSQTLHLKKEWSKRMKPNERVYHWAYTATSIITGCPQASTILKLDNISRMEAISIIINSLNNICIFAGRMSTWVKAGNRHKSKVLIRTSGSVTHQEHHFTFFHQNTWHTVSPPINGYISIHNLGLKACQRSFFQISCQFYPILCIVNLTSIQWQNNITRRQITRYRWASRNT